MDDRCNPAALTRLEAARARRLSPHLPTTPQLRQWLRVSAAAAVCALGVLVGRIALEGADAEDSLLERWIESVTGDIL